MNIRDPQGKGSVNGVSIDVDYRDDALYPSYTQRADRHIAGTGW